MNTMDNALNDIDAFERDLQALLQPSSKVSL